MKTKGIVRKVDELGRIVLPVEMRRMLDVEVKDPVEITIEGDTVILRKHHPYCVFCSEAKSLIRYRGKLICEDCLRDLKDRLDEE